MTAALPPARRRADPGASGYCGVRVRRVRTPRRTYWYFTVAGKRRGAYTYFPYTADGLAAAIAAAEARTDCTTHGRTNR